MIVPLLAFLLVVVTPPLEALHLTVRGARFLQWQGLLEDHSRRVSLAARPLP